MLKLSFTFLLFIFCQSSSSDASNSFIASGANQVIQGRFCGQVKREEINKACLACSALRKSQMERASGSADSTLEALVFDQAARYQVVKNLCLSQKIRALENDPKKKRQWVSMLVAAWLGMKKSQLVLKTCEWVAMNSTPLSNSIDHTPADPPSDYERRRFEIKDALNSAARVLEPLCRNQKTMSALSMSKELFQFSLPVISSPAFFEVVERSRHKIINKRTGRPISDFDLLGADLTNLNFVELKLDQEFEKNIDAALTAISEDRRQVVNRLKSVLSADHVSNLNGDLKDYLFEDGTVNSVMEKAEMIDQDSPDENTTGAQCLLARYEKRLGGEVADFSVTTVAGGVALRGLKVAGFAAKETLAGWGLAKNIKLTNDLAQVTAFQKLKESLKFGVLTSGSKQMLGDLYNSCRSETFHNLRARNISDLDAGISISSNDLPPSVGYDRWNLKIDENDAPSCKEATEQNLIQASSDESSCAKQLITAALPLKLAIPFSLLSSN